MRILQVAGEVMKQYSDIVAKTFARFPYDIAESLVEAIPFNLAHICCCCIILSCNQFQNFVLSDYGLSSRMKIEEKRT